jgi:hydrogenase expression/formation protein HypE
LSGRGEGERPRPSKLSEETVLARIEKVRRRAPRLTDQRITLSHGAGGSATRRLVEALFLETFRNPVLETLEDQAVFDIKGGTLAFATDSYVVSPLFFPGGNIGDLAVNGTVNDLAVSGARPLYLSAGFILEEGFPIEQLRRIVQSMQAAAATARVEIATGDTKVVERGKGDGCYINTAGVGVLERSIRLSAARAQPGDVVLVSGPIGDHGVTILLARGELELESEIVSDTAPLASLVASLLDATTSVRCLRDATRGGVATVLNEIALAADVGIRIDEEKVPVRDEVRGSCELLGMDPLHVACEGRLVAVVGGGEEEIALEAMRSDPAGRDAKAVGRVLSDPRGTVLLQTKFGGTRIVDLLVGDPLPRIC